MLTIAVTPSFIGHSTTNRRQKTKPESADDSPGILILNVLFGLARATPHFDIRPKQKPPTLSLHRVTEDRQMNPRYRRMFMVNEMPVVIQPKPVYRFPQTKITRATGDMTLGS